MPKDKIAAAVSALLADSVSRRMKSSKSTSSTRKRKSEPCEVSCPRGSPPNSKLCGPREEPPDAADDLLKAFMLGKTALVLDGVKHWFKPQARRTYTLHEIATIMGVTRERVRQIEASAMRKIFRKFSTIARSEGENPIEWFRNILKTLDDRDTGIEYDTK
jgi:hypothetical protein